MNPRALLDKLNELLGRSPERRYYLKWAAIFCGIIAASAAVTYPLASHYAAAKIEAQDYAASIKRMESLNVSAQNYARRVEELKREAESEAARYIQPSDMPSVIAHISKMALTFQVSLKKTNSLPASTVPDFADTTRLPLVLEVSGFYPNVGNFLESVTQGIPWFFTLDRAKIRTGRPAGHVDVTIELSYYSRTPAK